jgi:PBP1b-binding outer membrane lipoprotein LpoB
MVAMVAMVALAVSLLLGACSTAAPKASDGKAMAVSGAPTAEQRAALVPTATGTKPSGPNVGKLIAIADIKKILGRDDIVFSPAL